MLLFYLLIDTKDKEPPIKHGFRTMMRPYMMRPYIMRLRNSGQHLCAKCQVPTPVIPTARVSIAPINCSKSNILRIWADYPEWAGLAEWCIKINEIIEKR